MGAANEAGAETDLPARDRASAASGPERSDAPTGSAAPDREIDPLPTRGRRSVFVAVLLAAAVLGAFVLLLVGAKEPDSRSTVVGKPAPAAERAFTTLAGGDQVRLADFSGRYVVLNFFASWCTPCLCLLYTSDAADE